MPVYFEMMPMQPCLQKKAEVSQCDISVFESYIRRCFLHRWKVVSRTKPESRRVWSYDTCSRWKKCYCGKSGCADAYCAASVLTEDNRQSLDAFMENLESGDKKVLQIWNEYLDHLAV